MIEHSAKFRDVTNGLDDAHQRFIVQLVVHVASEHVRYYEGDKVLELLALGCHLNGTHPRGERFIAECLRLPPDAPQDGN